MTGCNLLTLTVKGRMMVLMSEPSPGIPEWTLGWKLKRALSYADLSAQDMAAELGVHVATVSRWMNDREHPRRAYLMAWALRCGVPFGWLTGDESVNSVTNPDIPSGMSVDHALPPTTAELKAMIRRRIPLTMPEIIALVVAA